MPGTLLFVNPAAERGGGEVVLLNLVRHLPAFGWLPVVVLLAPGPLAAELRACGVPTYVFPAGRFRQPWHFARTVLHVWSAIRRERPMLVDAAGAKGHLYAGLAALAAGVPAVWRLQDFPPRRDAWSWLASRVPAVGLVANSNATLEAYRDRYRLPKHVEVIYPGIELDTVPEDGASPTLRQDLGIPAERKVVTMVGRLQRWKGQHVFLRAAARVLQRRSDVQFLIVGGTVFGIEPEYAQELQRLVADEGIADHVVFTGQRRDVPHLLKISNVLVHASVTPEAFGQVVVEGMAAGLPVIASAAGGPIEIIHHDRDGILVTPDDPAVLAEALLALLSDPPRASRIGKAAQVEARAYHSAGHMASRFAQTYGRWLQPHARDHTAEEGATGRKRGGGTDR